MLEDPSLGRFPSKPQFTGGTIDGAFFFQGSLYEVRFPGVKIEGVWWFKIHTDAYPSTRGLSWGLQDKRTLLTSCRSTVSC